MAGKNPKLIVDVAANIDELRKGLRSGKVEVELTSAAMQKLEASFRGDTLVKEATKVVAVLNNVGTSALSATAATKQLDLLDRAMAQMGRTGQTVDPSMSAMAQRLREIAPPADGATMSIGNLWGKVTGFAGALGIGLGVTALVGYGKALIEAAGHTVDLAETTGLSLQGVQKFGFIAEQTGGSVDDFAKATFKLGVALQTGGPHITAALRDLGVSYAQIRALAPEEQFDLIARALSGVERPQERNRLGVELMSKSYEAIAPAMRQYVTLIDKASTAMDKNVIAIDRGSDAVSGLMTTADAFVTDTLGRLVRGVEQWGKWLEAANGGTIAVKVSTEDLARAAVLLANVQDPLGAKTKFIAEMTREYAAANVQAGMATVSTRTALQDLELRLDAQRDVITMLAPTLKAHIVDLVKQGASVEEVASAYQHLALTPSTITSIIKATEAQAKASKVAADAAKDHAAQLAKAMQIPRGSTSEILGTTKDISKNIDDWGKNAEKALPHIADVKIETGKVLMPASQITKQQEDFEKSVIRTLPPIRTTADLYGQMFSSVSLLGQGLGQAGDLLHSKVLTGVGAVLDTFTRIVDTADKIINSVTGIIGALTGGGGGGGGIAGLLGNLGGGGGGAGGLLGKIPGLGGLFGGGASAATGVLGSGAIAAGAGGVPAAVGGAGAAGGGAGAGLGGLLTNPFTIGAGAVIGIGLIGKKLWGDGGRDKVEDFGNKNTWGNYGRGLDNMHKFLNDTLGHGFGEAEGNGLWAAMNRVGKKDKTGARAWEESVIQALAEKGITGLQRFQHGGLVRGSGGPDSVPALLTPGERVLTQDQSDRGMADRPIVIENILMLDGEVLARLTRKVTQRLLNTGGLLVPQAALVARSQ